MRRSSQEKAHEPQNRTGSAHLTHVSRSDCVNVLQPGKHRACRVRSRGSSRQRRPLHRASLARPLPCEGGARLARSSSCAATCSSASAPLLGPRDAEGLGRLLEVRPGLGPHLRVLELERPSVRAVPRATAHAHKANSIPKATVLRSKATVLRSKVFRFVVRKLSDRNFTQGQPQRAARSGGGASAHGALAAGGRGAPNQTASAITGMPGAARPLRFAFQNAARKYNGQIVKNSVF